MKVNMDGLAKVINKVRAVETISSTHRIALVLSSGRTDLIACSLDKAEFEKLFKEMAVVMKSRNPEAYAKITR